MSEDRLKNWEAKAESNSKAYKRMLEKTPKKEILKQLPLFHEEAVSRINCLDCARCCKNYSPRFKTPDIRRISKHLRLRESEFIDRYLYVDEEGDYVLKTKPCPFLGEDHTCSIYEVRPSDCARFPYTDEDVIIRRPKLTLKNASFCPITYYVLESLRIDLQEKGK